MKMSFNYLSLLLIALVSICGCDSLNENEPDLLLDVVGFTGSLPLTDGRIFGNNGVEHTNSPNFSSNNNNLYVYHELAIRNLDSEVEILLELPSVKIKDEVEITHENSYELAKEYYSYEMVKEQLSIGDKLIRGRYPNMGSDNRINDFVIRVTDRREYVHYALMVQDFYDEGNFLKVISLFEGKETNQQGDEVRFMEVIFDLDITLIEYKIGQSVDKTLKRNITGQLRLKYSEEFSGPFIYSN